MKNKFPLFGPNSNGMIQPRGGAKLGNFGNPKQGPFDAVTPVHPEDAEAIKRTYEWPVPVIFPRTGYAPEGARTIDLRKLVTVPAGAQGFPIMGWTASSGMTAAFHHYGLVLPDGGFPDVSWFGGVDEYRIVSYHGDPALVASANPSTILNLPTGADFSFNCLVECQVLMQPGQVMIWSANNNTNAPVRMGLRLVGYSDGSQQLLSSKFGD